MTTLNFPNTLLSPGVAKKSSMTPAEEEYPIEHAFLIGRARDGRIWRLIWSMYSDSSSSGEPPHWVVTVNGAPIGALPFSMHAALPEAELRAAIAQLLQEHGITE